MTKDLLVVHLSIEHSIPPGHHLSTLRSKTSLLAELDCGVQIRDPEEWWRNSGERKGWYFVGQLDLTVWQGIRVKTITQPRSSVYFFFSPNSPSSSPSSPSTYNRLLLLHSQLWTIIELATSESSEISWVELSSGWPESIQLVLRFQLSLQNNQWSSKNS